MTRTMRSQENDAPRTRQLIRRSCPSQTAHYEATFLFARLFLVPGLSTGRAV
jgi:hypothetical protein